MVKVANHNKRLQSSKKLTLFPPTPKSNAIETDDISIYVLNTKMSNILRTIKKYDGIFHNVFKYSSANPVEIKKKFMKLYGKDKYVDIHDCQAIVINGYPQKDSLNGVYKRECVVDGYPQFRFMGRWGSYDDIVLHRYCPKPDSNPRWMISCRASVKKGRGWAQLRSDLFMKYDEWFDWILSKSNDYFSNKNMLEITDNPAGYGRSLWETSTKMNKWKWEFNKNFHSVGYTSVEEAIKVASKLLPFHSIPFHLSEASLKYEWVWQSGSHDGKVVSKKLLKTLILIDENKAKSSLCSKWIAIRRQIKPSSQMIKIRSCPRFTSQVPFQNITMAISTSQQSVSSPQQKKYDPLHFCQSWATCCEENLKLQPIGTISKRVTRSMTRT
tara:strand:- start:282 stop:1433 length:1152 start_codon:yes stop_codon:yes gene_type:complete